MQAMRELAPSGLDKSTDGLVCFEVAFGDDLRYEAYLRKIEGALLSVGRAAHNTIIMPDPGIAEHQLDIFYSQGLLWVEDKGDDQVVLLDGSPVSGTRSMRPGACIELGPAQLSLVRF
jgi:pSer/pThr/pTyr-binding forkhead associated (FHA) protein